jgi:hypothetical protein
MYKLFVLAFCLWITENSLLTKEFDSKDKNLQKELLKVSGTNSVTWTEITIPDSLAFYGPIHGKYLTFTEPNDQKKYVYIGRVNSCRQGGCSNPAETMNVETPEYFDYLIVFDSNISVAQVKVYNYQATHGQEITNKSWLKQFQGYNGSRSLTVGKSIDAISGATVSVFGITTDIQEKTKMLKRIVAQ